MNEVETNFKKHIKNNKKFNIYYCAKQTGKTDFVSKQVNKIVYMDKIRQSVSSIYTSNCDLFIDFDVIGMREIINNETARLFIDKHLAHYNRYNDIHVFLTPNNELIQRLQHLTNLFEKHVTKLSVETHNRFAVRKEYEKAINLIIRRSPEQFRQEIMGDNDFNSSKKI